MSAEKTIDGLPVRQATFSRAAKIKSPKHSTSNLFASKKIKKITIEKGEPNDPLKTKAKVAEKEEIVAAEITTERLNPDDAHNDFLKAPETFDLDLTSDDLKKSKKSKRNKKDKKPSEPKGKKKPGKARKIITSILLTLVLLVIGGVVWVLIWGNDIIARLTGGNSDIWSAIGAFTSDTYVELKTDTNGRTNILVFGTSGYDMDGHTNGTTHDGSQLTDSIMAIGIDQTTGDVVMTSIPRDLKASGACYAGKINEVYLCGSKGTDEAAGAEALMSSVSEVLGINFQYYAHINWGSLVQIVNALGGITITLDEPVNDQYYTGAVYQAGVPYTIDGEAAVSLARARHGTTGGDFSRGTSQQRILIGIKDKVTQKLDEGSFDLATALNLVQALGDNLRTNISVEEIKTGLHLMGDLDFNQMRQVMLYDYNNYANSLMKTANINGLSFVIPSAGVGNYSRIQATIAKEFSTNTIEREAAKILILNGTDTSGLAVTEGKALEEAGYTIAELGNAPEGEYDAKYSIYLINSNGSGTAKELRGLYNAEIQSADDLPEGIDSTGFDIIIILGKK